MFMKSAITALFALAATANQVAGQTQNATAAEVALVEANMQQAGLIPGLLSQDEVDLEATLDVSFGSNMISIGQEIAATETQSAPTVTVHPLSGTDDFESSQLYTVMLVDADVAGTDNQVANQTFHWLANGVSVGADGALDFGIASTAIDYVGPGPLEGTGPHRYVLLMVEQDAGFTAPAEFSSFGAHPLRQYLETEDLGEVRAANFFVVSGPGATTVSVQPTTSVDPATVVVVATSATTTGTATEASSTVVTSTGAQTGSMSMGTASASSTRTGASTGAASGTSTAPANGAVSGKVNGVWTVGAALVGAAAGVLLI